MIPRTYHLLSCPGQLVPEHCPLQDFVQQTPPEANFKESPKAQPCGGHCAALDSCKSPFIDFLTPGEPLLICLQTSLELIDFWPMFASWAGWWPSSPTLTCFPGLRQSPSWELVRESMNNLDNFLLYGLAPHSSNRHPPDQD